MQLSTSLFTALLTCSPAASLLAQGVPGGGGTVDTHGFVSVTGTVDANINATVPGDADADAVAGAALGTKAFSADAGTTAATLNGVSEARGRATVVDSSTSSRVTRKVSERPAKKLADSPSRSAQASKVMAVAPAAMRLPVSLPQLLAGYCQYTPTQPPDVGVQVHDWQAGAQGSVEAAQALDESPSISPM